MDGTGDYMKEVSMDAVIYPTSRQIASMICEQDNHVRVTPTEWRKKRKREERCYFESEV